MVYGCYVHLWIVHQTVGPAWVVQAINRLSTVIICHQHASATQRIDPGGQTVRPPATTHVRLTPCMLHACEFGPFSAETIEMAGAWGVGHRLSNTQQAAAQQVSISPTQPNLHGLMVSMDAW